MKEGLPCPPTYVIIYYRSFIFSDGRRLDNVFVYSLEYLLLIYELLE
jgi:hypothetical protein